MANNFFDGMFDLEKLRMDAVDAANANDNFNREEIPHGEYCVSVDEIKLVETKNHFPAMRLRFKIQDPNSKFDQRFIFYTQTLHTGVGINIALQTLKKVTFGMESMMYFDSFEQLSELFSTVAEATKGWVYNLHYSENAKGYPVYNINGMEAI